jgi:hypothetical protein
VYGNWCTGTWRTGTLHWRSARRPSRPRTLVGGAARVGRGVLRRTYFETNLGWRSVPDTFAQDPVDKETGHTQGRALRFPEQALETGFTEFRSFE